MGLNLSTQQIAAELDLRPDDAHDMATHLREGIRPEDLPFVFDRFYRGEKSRSRVTTGGAGLGLAIAQGIVEAHSGSIRVESEVGHGARFVFVLPS